MNQHEVGFHGFPRELPEFLFSLQFNNTVEGLPETKPMYKRLITEPLLQLFYALEPAALSVSDTLVTKPSRCVSTMYTDMRFSKTAPLKEYMYIRFREPNCQQDILGLYFDMGREHYSYGIRIYKQTSAGMERIRRGIIDNQHAFTKALQGLNVLEMTVKGDKYAKDRYADINNPAIRELLNHRNFYIGRDRPINEGIFNSELAKEISSAFIGLKDMYQSTKKAMLISI